MILISRIREKLTEKRLSVHALERIAGLHRGAVQNILSGKSKNPSVYNIQAISKALGCTISSLIEGDAPSSDFFGSFSSQKERVNKEREPTRVMPSTKSNLPQDIYSEHLTAISGVKFTRREIDVVACLLSGRSSKTIARFLSIEEKTVETHKYNIMRKLDCNSRESIRDFIEKSDKFSEIKKHYLNLLIHAAFKKSLHEIASLGGKENLVCWIIYSPEQENNPSLIHRLEKHLKLAGLKIQIEWRGKYKSITQLIHMLESQQVDSIIYSVSEALMGRLQDCDSKAKLEIAQFTQRAAQNPGAVIFLLEERETPIDIPQELINVSYVDFSAQENYYFSIFELLKRVLPNINLDKIISGFNIQYEIIYNSSESENSSPQIWSEVDSFLQKENIHNNHIDRLEKKGGWLSRFYKNLKKK